MVLTRAQEQSLSRLEVAVVDIQKTLDQRFAELRDLLGLRIDCDEEQLPVMDDETDLLVTTIVDPKVEIHKSLVHKAILEEKSASQFQVPVSDLERGLQIHNVSPTVCEDSQYVVSCDELCEHQRSKSQVPHVKEMEEFSHQSTNGNGENVAHQVFGKMSQHETLGIKKKTKGFKCWRFKFKQRKQQRGKLRPAHKLIHRGDVMENDHVYQEGLPLWLLVRFRFWKFKFINRKLQKMMREQGFANHLKLMYDKGEHDELFIMARTVSKRSLLGLTFGIRESNAGEDQRAVCEQIIKMNVWLYQISWVLQQVMRSKKIKFPKRWMFKYKYGKEGIQRLQIQFRYMSWLEFEERFKSWRKHKTMQLQVILNMLFVRIRRESQKILSIVKLLFQNSLVHPQQAVNADDERHIMVCVDKSDGQLFWMVFIRKPVIRAVQRIWEKETHDVDIIDANSVLQEEFEQVVNHTPFSVVKLEGLLLLGDESFQIKHKWRFKLLPLILGCELYSDRLVFVTNYAQQFDISVFFYTNLEVKVSLKEGDLIQKNERDTWTAWIKRKARAEITLTGEESRREDI